MLQVIVRVCLTKNDCFALYQVAALKLEVESLQSAAAEQQAAAGDETSIKMALDGLEKERDFYFKKLRDIEVYLQELGDVEEMQGQAKEIAQKVFAVLYATDDDDFEAPPSAVCFSIVLPPHLFMMTKWPAAFRSSSFAALGFKKFCACVCGLCNG